MKNRDKSSGYYPIFLNIRGKRCLVVGGGEVALRKVKTLLEHGADVEVVSLKFCPELNKLTREGKIKSSAKAYNSTHLKGALIAIAATDDADINERISSDARKQGVLVNVVDVPEHSDFIVPSTLTRGDIAIAVSTSGKSPALARKIRTELESKFGDEYAKLAETVSAIRIQLKQEGIILANEAWQEILELDMLAKLLRQDKFQEAKDTMLNKLRKLGPKKP
ncbi:MAG: bifunctional precorrin-2 dehydrogenase/sirohydrochlorin ferrochelatase [Chloroflexi bacterium]|nr:bifunctional precorrin-2 dehydrogenase/sirohydrochlorin ferrochelatase [Chloroflexota bacterium]MBM3154246.1 bifunctional precorrin-2 dehydrogenase/sirohydrochlorin ferrochelatase [Chloroflexota bacterium]MBM3172205.1 bifunctional precorrin-2 dehydrogenase/sirohydrochlorin ferrochelatase [Chloroflexota bacterium]MBM3174197.1 bifunctional precorrin-2 dehydrogenase/sirohydrochlorin ferrochelatase [Chloroflexota bacterium]MBM4450181.1 bifunctional precorrin-2 dehydrogenase/sirohydrochlorin ferr